MHDSACRWLIAENMKIFRKYFEYFEFFHVKEIIESWLVYGNKFSWIIQSCFLTKTINDKTKLVQASFSYIEELLWEKKKNRLKSVIIITVIISLHYKETNKTALVTFKSVWKSSWKMVLGAPKTNSKILCKINQKILNTSKYYHGWWKALQLMCTWLLNTRGGRRVTRGGGGRSALPFFENWKKVP